MTVHMVTHTEVALARLEGINCPASSSGKQRMRSETIYSVSSEPVQAARLSAVKHARRKLGTSRLSLDSEGLTILGR